MARNVYSVGLTVSVCVLFTAPATIQREPAKTDKISQRLLVMPAFL